MNNLGMFYAAQQRDGDAERYFNQSLSLLQKTVGPDHPYVTQAQRDYDDFRAARR